VLEPQWPLDDAKAFVKSAHAAGKRVIPFDVTTAAHVRAAKRAGADGVITDDPALARAVVDCENARAALKRELTRLKAAKAALRRARTAKQKRAAGRRLKAANRRATKARRAVKRACA
jgi:hypothetical protein